MLHVAQLLPGSSKAKGPQTVEHYPVVEGAAARLDSACLPGNARVRDKGPVHLHIGAGARGLLDTPAAALTQHSNCVEIKLVSNSSLGRRLKGSPRNCYMLLEKTTK